MTALADAPVQSLHARNFVELSRLIHPIDPAIFERDYWEQRPLRVQRDDPEHYRDLLTLDDLDEVLSRSTKDLDNIRVVIAGKETPVSELESAHGHNSLEGAYQHYRNGSTIVVNHLNDRWEPLRRMAAVLGAELSARLQMNIYLTPPGNQGFGPHYDMHDVFVAQVHGEKHWRLASQPLALPLDGQPYDKSLPEPEPEQEFDLRAGDVLYLPRGTIHWATANENTSAHVTIGVHPTLYSQVIQRAVRVLCTKDARFRAGLPMGFATDEARQHRAADTIAELLDAVRAQLSPQDMVAGSVKQAASTGLPNLRHHLTDLEHLDRIGLTTRVRRRPALRFHISVDDAVVSVDFHGKTVRLPASVADEVRYVASSNGDGCTGASIPGDLDEDGRLVLISTLVREGFLTRA